ncbi:MAG: D-aminoacyl-tRNA deacylase [Coriobacteriales bacterium]|nr:D-aminoacyl-tRNA deacylase [Coriobacteriales bacterium]
MRALVQRVSSASVVVEGEVVGRCGLGFLVLLGVGPEDSEELTAKLWNKIRALRVFEDDAGKMNRSLLDVQGEVLVISQFTLFADCRRGNRPSFVKAAGPELGSHLYDHFCDLAAADVPCGRGVFGAHMQVSLVNDGPVTIWLDTDELTRPKRG